MFLGALTVLGDVVVNFLTKEEKKGDTKAYLRTMHLARVFYLTNKNGY